MDIITLPVTEVPSPILKAEQNDSFVNKQLVMRTFDCLDGELFESQFLQQGDRYAEVKLAGSSKQNQKYIQKVKEYIDDETIQKLLYCCRLSSYLGGPGFPDVMVFGHTVEFRYTSEEFRQEQIMFLLLAKELNIQGFGILQMIPQGQQVKERAYQIDIQGFVKTVLKESRAVHYEKELQDILWKEQEKLTLEKDDKKAKQIRDEITYLEHQQAGMPFQLLRAWSEGRANIADHFRRLSVAIQQEGAILRTCEERVKMNPAFQTIGKGMDDASLNKRRAWIMELCDIGESHADRVMRRV